MNKRIALFWALIAILMILTPLRAAKASTQEGFKKITLSNGLTLNYKIMKDQPMISMYAVVPIGMNREREKGIAHLLEHMIFRGGGGYNFVDVMNVTNRQGGTFSGFTTFYATTYNYVVPKDKFDEAFNVFNANLWSSNLAASDLALEKKIVLHESEMSYSQRLSFYPVIKYFYPETNYSEATVNAITDSELKEFYQSYYQPDNVTYFMAGDFDPNIVIKRLQQLKNVYGEKEVPVSAIKEYELPQKVIVESRNIYPYQYQIMLAYEFDGLDQSERMVLKVLSYLYGYNFRIDYEKNEFKDYYLVTRSIGNKEYFGLYHSESTHPYEESSLTEVKTALLKLLRQFKKTDLSKERKVMTKLVKIEQLDSNKTAAASVEYEVQRLIDPENITVDSLEILEKLQNKDLEKVIEKCFAQPPKATIIIKSTEKVGE